MAHIAPPKSDEYSQALTQNHDWAVKTAKDNPDLFPTLSKGQKPKILWLGCSDSRVPETTLLGLKPGDVFVHRNIANVLPSTDLSSQSVIQYAVEHVKVQHVVVCGHTSCGGAAAALGNAKLGVIDLWLQPLRKLRLQLSGASDWEGLGDGEKGQRLIEANVKAGVQTLLENPDVIEAIHERGLQVHGLVYDITCGELKELKLDEEGESVTKLRDGAFGCK